MKPGITVLIEQRGKRIADLAFGKSTHGHDPTAQAFQLAVVAVVNVLSEIRWSHDYSACRHAPISG